LVDHFIVRRRQAAQTLPAVRLSGLVAWFVGIAAYHAFSRLAPDMGATLPSFAIAAVSYLTLRLPLRR
ncbi:MAG: putative hydroxymethylpyrimidine transporter CytX, partial [Caulobacterales bacterium]|nr:putative hydroxymethylpyrimidine transporter CytX [Caulobacterales bacterium]